MNKSELIDALSQKASISKENAKKALEAVIQVTKEELQKGEKIALVGFGTFSVVERAARNGVNPLTKQPINVPAKKLPKFKPGKKFSKAVK